MTMTEFYANQYFQTKSQKLIIAQDREIKFSANRAKGEESGLLNIY